MFSRKRTPAESAVGHNTLVSRKITILASMAHVCVERTSRRAEIPPRDRGRPPKATVPLCGAARSAASFLVEESHHSGLSSPYTHAPCWLKVSLSSKLRCCAQQLPPAFFTGRAALVQLPPAFFPAKKLSRSEVGQKSQNFESSQNGLAYSGKS